MRWRLVMFLIMLSAVACFAQEQAAPSREGLAPLDAAGRAFDVDVVASSRDIHVLCLRSQSDEAEVDWTAPSYLLIQSGENAFLQPLNGLVGSVPGFVDRVDAVIVDLGKEPGVIASITGGVPHVGYTVVRVYGVSAESVEALGEVQYLSNRELATTLSAARTAGRDWSRVRIGQTAEADPRTPAIYQRVYYFVYDPADQGYLPEDYTAQFDRQTVVQEDAYTPTTFVYYHLSDDGVRLREQPSTQSGVLKMLPQTATFEILDRTDDFQTVGGVTERWYKVLLKDGQGEGWIFGGHIRRAGQEPLDP